MVELSSRVCIQQSQDGVPRTKEVGVPLSHPRPLDGTEEPPPDLRLRGPGSRVYTNWANRGFVAAAWSSVQRLGSATAVGGRPIAGWTVGGKSKVFQHSSMVLSNILDAW